MITFLSNDKGVKQTLGNVRQLVIIDQWTNPICSTISLACLMIFAPVWQTMPAISMEYHLALNTTQYQKWQSLKKNNSFSSCKLAVINKQSHNPQHLLWLSLLGGPLMLPVNLPIAGTVQPHCNKFVANVKINATGDSKLNGSLVECLWASCRCSHL